ncbi:e3 ubiquitin-protein ligase RNF13 [Trichonephila clavipes]|nr:e3 ubiquitin-protein ligase RNF13 [Trichonephila clavipes]
MPPHSITPVVGAVCRCKVKAELRRSPRDLHTRTRLSSLLKLNQDLSLKTTWFRSVAVQSVVHDSTPNGGVGGQVSLAAHVMDPTIPDVLQPGALQWFGKTQRPVVKVLPVCGQRPMR